VGVARVEITDVRTPHHPGMAGAIDAPKPNAVRDSYVVDVVGWVHASADPVTAVQGVHRGRPLGRSLVNVPRPDVVASRPQHVGADRCGFSFSINALRLSIEFDIQLDAIAADGTRSSLASIAGRRAPIRVGDVGGPDPVLVTTLGRTGSTLMASVLAAHPQVFVYQPFRYEPRVVHYWIDVLLALGDPGTAFSQIVPQASLGAHWWLREPHDVFSRDLEPDLRAWFGSVALEELARFCVERIKGLYSHQSKAQGTDCRYFAEKVLPTHVPPLARELFPQAREVFLVRDFRDVVASVFAYNRKRGQQGFGRHLGETEVEYVQRFAANSVPQLVEAWRSRSQSATLIRYEELIEDPRAQVDELLRALQLEADEETRRGMAQMAVGNAPGARGHRTTEDASASVGRWRDDLSSEVREVAESAFEPALEAFGYRT
jgi:LPS sulfotransferase NodH